MTRLLTSAFLCLLLVLALQAQPEDGRDYYPGEKILQHTCLTTQVLGPNGYIPVPIPNEWINATDIDVKGAGGHTHEIGGMTRARGEFVTTLGGTPGETVSRQRTGPTGCVDFVFQLTEFAGEVSFIWKPENPTLSTASKWVKHRVLVKQVNPSNGQNDKLLDKLHDSEGLYDPLSVYYQDFRHKTDSGQPGEDRYGTDLSRFSLAAMNHAYMNAPGNPTHIPLITMHGACKWGGICDSEFGAHSTSPMLFEWGFRPNKKYRDGYDWDIENPVFQTTSPEQFFILWSAFVDALYDVGGGFAMYTPTGGTISISKSEAEVTAYWSTQDSIHVVFSAARPN